MQARSEATSLLYVADRNDAVDPSASQFGFDERAVSLTTATTSTATRAFRSAGEFDCVLFDLGSADRFDVVIELREAAPVMPFIVCMDGDSNADIESLLTLDRVEVIPSPVSETPAALIRDRIESVLGDVSLTGAVAPDRERDQLLATIMEHVGDVVWMLDADKQRLAFVNEAFEQVWGRSREQLYAEPSTVLKGVHPDDSDRVREALDSLFATPDTYEITYRVVQPDGEVRWVHDRAFGVYEDGQLQRVVGLAQDITKHKQRETQLEIERDLIEHIYETSPVGICVFDQDGAFVRANDRAATILGLSNEELIGRSYDDETWVIRDVDGEHIAAEEFPVARVLEAETPLYDWEGQLERPDGTQRWVSVNASPLADDDQQREHVVVAIEDITDRKRREEQIESQRDELAELDRINQIIRDVDSALVGAQSRTEIEQAVCDRLAASTQYDFAVSLRRNSEGALEPSTWTAEGNEYVEKAFAVDPEQPGPGRRAIETGETHIVQSVEDGRQSWTDIAKTVGIEGLAAVPVVYEEREYGVIGVYTTQADAFGDREVEVLDELGETVGYAIAAVQSREREQTLTALYEATQELLAADTAQAVCEVVVETAASVLDPSGLGVFIFEDEENVLRLETGTDQLRTFYDSATTFGPGHADSEAWQVYATGEPRYFADIRTAEHVTDADTEARSAYIVPLGEHGVFVVASEEIDVLDDQKRQLVGLLAATTEAALDRVTGREDIRERDQQLDERTNRLIRLEQTLQFVRETNRLLRRANTRAEIEHGVCERVVDIEEHRFAWLGTNPPDQAELLPQAYAGDGNSYLDSVSLAVDGEEPAALAARTGQIVTSQDVTDKLHDTDWAHMAADRAFQSVLSVPLVYGQTTYGVLTVYSDEPNAFGDGFETMLADLGETIAFGINTVETRQAILADCVTELELDIGEANGFPNAVAEIADDTVTFREIQPTTDGGTQLLFELTDPPVDEILALESAFVSVESLTHLSRGDTQLFRATLSGDTVATTLFDCGAVPGEVVATAERTTAVVQLPQELDVRVFLGRLETHYPAVELLSRSDVESQPDSHERAWVVLEEELTERQREVLLTAYESGYFQSPRETTGAELAALFDISQPTLTYHLREAQRRLFESLFSNHAESDT